MSPISAAKKLNDVRGEGPSVLHTKPEPEISLPNTHDITIQIVCKAQELDYPCSFWVGLMANGSHSPSSLLDLPEATSILTEASTHGVVEREPLMLSDSRSVPPRHVFLLPRPPAEFRVSAAWIHKLIQTVSSWAPEQIGVYIAPILARNDATHELMLTVLRELISSRAARQFFLFTGEHGFHSILNAALRLKNELATDPKCPPVLVFH